MEHRKQEAQHSFTLGRTWGNLPKDISQSDIFQRPYGNHQRLESQQPIQTLRTEGSQTKGESSHNPGYREGMDPERGYYDSFRLIRSRPAQISSGFTLLRIQQNSGQESLLFTIQGSFKWKTRTKGKEQEYFQTEEEIIILNDPEVVRLSSINSQKQQIIVNKPDRISKATVVNDIHTQNDHSVFTFESNLKSNGLWLRMSQFSEQTHKEFGKLNQNNLRLQELITPPKKETHSYY
ncbi:hypothetical protein O181_107534 [Austropuccinia psidii MF-1]|uniref:Uncharacterized protein n=1 Tax=Austropuccinia psidii MF-1 TaxID=1389203 RepID=A0A9Q3JU91_9BASI|nr:hypothetical protein [Austropuccinia psidii MF-1]